ncbi:MAG: hypothetical protein KGK08_00055 [Acidobacteriota bacterium]|nr:hypothetical protein [Acidobacteriota bacterium]
MTGPPARDVRDGRTGIRFHLPQGWTLARRDGEVSTFALDARSAPRTAQLRAVASINYNPFPQTNFGGAFFYASVVPRLDADGCARQASAMGSHPTTTRSVAGVVFTRGYDEHGGICIESRDDVYTAMHGNACYRFDLVINNFCGGDVSGTPEMSASQLEKVRQRLEEILDTVQLDPR